MLSHRSSMLPLAAWAGATLALILLALVGGPLQAQTPAAAFVAGHPGPAPLAR